MTRATSLDIYIHEQQAVRDANRLQLLNADTLAGREEALTPEALRKLLNDNPQEFLIIMESAKAKIDERATKVPREELGAGPASKSPDSIVVIFIRCLEVFSQKFPDVLEGEALDQTVREPYPFGRFANQNKALYIATFEDWLKYPKAVEHLVETIKLRSAVAAPEAAVAATPAADLVAAVERSGTPSKAPVRQTTYPRTITIGLLGSVMLLVFFLNKAARKAFHHCPRTSFLKHVPIPIGIYVIAGFLLLTALIMLMGRGAAPVARVESAAERGRKPTTGPQQEDAGRHNPMHGLAIGGPRR